MFGPDPIIKDYMGLVSKFLTSSQTGVTSDPSKSVNIVLWETFDETIDLTGNLIEGEYYYFPALPNDQVKVKNGSSTVTLDFDNDGKIRNKNLGDFVDIGDIRLTLRGIGGTLTEGGPTTVYDFGSGVTAEITAPGYIEQFFPILAPSIIVTLEPIHVPSPIITLLPIVEYGSITTVCAILAPGCTYDKG